MATGRQREDPRPQAAGGSRHAVHAGHHSSLPSDARRPELEPLRQAEPRWASRVAISNGRLVAIEGDEVLFRYKDYKDGDQWKTARMPGVEFIGRFLQHVLPKGLRHIRRFGFMGPRVHSEKLNHIRELIGIAARKLDSLPGFQRRGLLFPYILSEAAARQRPSLTSRSLTRHVRLLAAYLAVLLWERLWRHLRSPSRNSL